MSRRHSLAETESPSCRGEAIRGSARGIDANPIKRPRILPELLRENVGRCIGHVMATDL